MSRVAKSPVVIPAGVEVALDGNNITVLNSNNNNNDSTIKNYKIDSYSNFHLLDEECFLVGVREKNQQDAHGKDAEV